MSDKPDNIEYKETNNLPNSELLPQAVPKDEDSSDTESSDTESSELK